LIGYQGFAKDQVGSLARLSQNGTLDPLDSTIYTTYSTNATQTKMQLMSFLEDSNNVTSFNSSFITEANASVTSDYSKRFPITLGDTLGILLSNGTGSLNQPVQETGTGVDLYTTTGSYVLQFDSKAKVSGTGTILTYGYLTYYPKNGLTGYWDMSTLIADGKLKDLSGNGNDGINFGVTFGGVSGKLGNATNFNGVSGYIDIPTSTTITNAFPVTLSIWIYPTGDQNYRDIIYKQGLTAIRMADGNAWTAPPIGTITPNKINIGRQGCGAMTSTIALTNNQWHHILLTADVTTSLQSLYIDGTLSSSFSLGPCFPSSYTTGLIIGGGWSGTFSGSIDEARIYNRVLSSIEIQSLYNATK
ncbi:MAG: LamG domain-containing protein, partial [Candidatus Gracilibacteria bacterium]